MNLNTRSGAGAGAIDLKIASSGAGALSIFGQLPSPVVEYHLQEFLLETNYEIYGRVF